MLWVLDITPLFILVYNSINSTKIPASGAGTVSEPGFMTQFGDTARSGGGVSIGLLT
jgi:hypothetical protein